MRVSRFNPIGNIFDKRGSADHIHSIVKQRRVIPLANNHRAVAGNVLRGAGEIFAKQKEIIFDLLLQKCFFLSNRKSVVRPSASFCVAKNRGGGWIPADNFSLLDSTQ